jgi:hypothetical protein
MKSPCRCIYCFDDGENKEDLIIVCRTIHFLPFKCKSSWSRDNVSLAALRTKMLYGKVGHSHASER